MKLKIIFIATLLFLAIPIQVVPAQPSEWLSIENEYFIVKYRLGYEADASHTLNTAMEVRSITMQKYPHHLPFKVEIYIYPSKEEIGPTAVIICGSSSATIKIVTPSWKGGWGGYETLGNPFKRILNHEYVHAPYYYDLYSKTKGYKDDLGWFNQGIAEYISQNYLPIYEQQVQRAVKDDDYTVTEYAFGLYMVEFMYSRYGQDKVIALIKSEASSFGAALRDVLGVAPLEFEDQWRTYLSEKFGGNYHLTNVSSKNTYSFIAAAPNPIGVGQTARLWFGITDQPQNQLRRWEGITVTITKPDGTIQTLGPFFTNSSGGTSTIYAPTMLGTYYLQANFPSQWCNQSTSQTLYQASASQKYTLTVQQSPVEFNLDYSELYMDLYMKLAAFDEKHQNLLNDYGQLNATYGGLYSDFGSLQASYSSLQSEVNSLKSKADSLQADRNTLQSKYDSLKPDYDSMKLTYSGLENEYANLQVQFEALQSDFDKLKANYNSLQSSIEQPIKENSNESAVDPKTLVFMTTTILFLITTIYLTINRQKRRR